jgi:hypothetical protein
MFLYKERMELPWSAILWKQFEILRSGREMNPKYGLTRGEYIRIMGDGLIKKCYGIKTLVLIDYACGVMENDIMVGTSYSSARTVIN